MDANRLRRHATLVGAVAGLFVAALQVPVSAHAEPTEHQVAAGVDDVRAVAEVEVSGPVVELRGMWPDVLDPVYCPVTSPSLVDREFPAPGMTTPRGVEVRVPRGDVVTAQVNLAPPRHGRSAMGVDGWATAWMKPSSIQLVLHCTDEAAPTISSPGPVEIGAPVSQQLVLSAGARVTAVAGLPQGLGLSETGLLTGVVPPSAGGDFAVEVKLSTDARAASQKLTLSVSGVTKILDAGSWTVPGEADRNWLRLPALQCPAEAPWLLNENFSGGRSVPSGVQIDADPTVEVAGMGFRGEQNAFVGMENALVTNLRGSEAPLSISLHCTNDLNRALR